MDILDNKKVTLVTATFYKSANELRFKLACEFVQKARQGGYWVVVVDASPNEAIATKLRQLGAYVVKQVGDSMLDSRRQGFQIAQSKAATGDVIMWTEPEKVDLINHLEKIVKPILEGKADVVIPRRTKKSWLTYPWYQYHTEMIINGQFQRLTEKLTRLRRIDITIGPVAFSCKAADELINFDPDYYGGVAPTYVNQYALLVAMINGAKIKSVDIDFLYPEAQKVQEESARKFADMLAKRFSQIDDIVRAFEKIIAIHPT